MEMLILIQPVLPLLLFISIFLVLQSLLLKMTTVRHSINTSVKTPAAADPMVYLKYHATCYSHHRLIL